MTGEMFVATVILVLCGIGLYTAASVNHGDIDKGDNNGNDY